MEHFIVSARKYRPKTFKDVVGQQAITNTLMNAIHNNHLAQALLFTGPRGVGKTSCARILAKTINQASNTNENEDFSFNIFELDAASNNSVDDIRNLIDQVRIPPQTGKYKVYIIDEVHMLSQAAFNAFLKTLEEPPKHAIFILATTEKHKIIPTILSRCQIFDFKRITVTDAKKHLMQVAADEGIIAEEEALQIIAQKADGAMRDALSIFDRVVSFCGKELTRKAVTENLNVLDYETYFKITDLIIDVQIPELLIAFNDILSQGFDGQHFIAGLASHFRDLLVSKMPETIPLLEVSETTKANYSKQSQRIDHQTLLTSIELANACDLNYKTSRNQRLLVELCLLQIASVPSKYGEKKNDTPYIIPPTPNQNSEVKSAVTNQNINKTHVAEVTDRIPASSQNEISELTKNTSNQNDQKTQSTLQNKQQELKPQIATPVSTDASTVSPTATPSTIPNVTTPNVATLNAPSIQSNQAIDTSQNTINQRKRRQTSGLSLKSIEHQKAHEQKKVNTIVDPKNLPKDSFTEDDVKQAWITYGQQQDKKGQRIIGSMFAMNLPELKEGKIHITLPNRSMKVDLENALPGFFQFLYKKLNNYSVEIIIHVNEEISKRYAFTPQEKYEKLLEINPLLDRLRSEFGLDI